MTETLLNKTQKLVRTMTNMRCVKERVCSLLLGSIFIKFKSPVAQYARESECHCALLTVKGFNRCAIRLNTLVKCSIQIAMKWYFVSGFTAIWSRQLNPDNPDNGWPITLKHGRVTGQSDGAGTCTANGRIRIYSKLPHRWSGLSKVSFFVVIQIPIVHQSNF